MKKICVFVVMFCISLCCLAQQKKTLNIVGETWKGVPNADGTGTYFDIVKAAFGDEFELNFQVTNWKRASHMVESGDADVLVGSYADNVDRFLYSKKHIDIEYPIYVIFDSNRFVPKGVRDLSGKLIAGRKGWGLQQYLPKSTQFYGVDSIKGISKLIESNRVDGALAYSYNVLLADPKKQFSTLEVVAEMPLYLGFTRNDRGKKLQALFDRNMETLIKNGTLKPLFASNMAYQHANLSPEEFPETVEWNLVPKVFQKNSQSLEAVPWELLTTSYIDSQITKTSLKLNINRFKETKHNIENKPEHCALGIRKSKTAQPNVLFSHAFHHYIEPRLFVLKGSQTENLLSALTTSNMISLSDILDEFPELNIALQNNFNLLDPLQRILSEDSAKRIIVVPKSDYENIIRLFTQKRIDALIVWPNIIADLNTLTDHTNTLLSFKINEKLASPLTTYIACNNSKKGQHVIDSINTMLKNPIHQRAIYEPFTQNLDVNSAQLYRKRLGLNY